MTVRRDERPFRTPHYFKRVVRNSDVFGEVDVTEMLVAPRGKRSEIR
jgi:hypothetical protein